MSHDEGRIRTVEDAGAEAVALFHKIGAERAENPIARPAVMERVFARIIDSIAHGLMIVVALTAYGLFFVDQPQGQGMGISVSSAEPPAWGPVSVGWLEALALAAAVAAAVGSEAAQTRIFGATFGMRRNQISVHSVRGGGSASLLQTAMRSAALALPFVFVLGLGTSSLAYALVGVGMVVYVSVSSFRDERQRGPHDKIAGTEVFSTDVRGS